MSIIQKKKAVYENIVVLVIHMLNAEDLLFEESAGILLGQYQEFILECSNILQQEEDCKDIILYNTCICGIFERRCKESAEKAVAVAHEINKLLSHFNSCRGDNDCEKSVYGIGVASGRAVTFTLKNAWDEYRRDVWMGPVFGRAQSMAKMAGIDGRKRIMVEDTVYNI